MGRSRCDANGQAAAEFAAVLPVFLLFVVLLFEIGGVIVDQVALEHVAREGARTAAVTSSLDRIRATAVASTDLPRDRISIEVGERPDVNDMVRVTAIYETTIVEPLTGFVIYRPHLSASVAMRVEDDPDV